LPFVRATRKANKHPKRAPRVFVAENELPFRKMSVVLAEFSASLLRTTKNERDARSALRLCRGAWNEGAKAATDATRAQSRRELAEYFGETWTRLLPIYDELVKVRLADYADDPRTIAGVEARLLPSGRLEITADSTW
jgi:hypothetical protein